MNLSDEQREAAITAFRGATFEEREAARERLMELSGGWPPEEPELDEQRTEPVARFVARTDEGREVAREQLKAMSAGWGRNEPDQLRTTLADVEREVAEEREQRAHPDTQRMVDVRDFEAAGGRFDLAESHQRLIDFLATKANHRKIAEAGLPPRGREIEDDL